MRLLVLLLTAIPLGAGVALADEGALQSIDKTGVIRLGYLENSPPFSFRGEDGVPQGYSVELCKRVAEGIRQQLKRDTLRLEWVPLSLQERIPAVRNRRVDIECGTTTWTLTRQQDVDFSLMTFVDGATVLVRSDSNLLNLADLNGKKVAVVPTTTTATALQAAIKAGRMRIEVVEVNSAEDGIAKLQQGDVDGYASDRVVLIGQGLGPKLGSTFKLLGEDFSVEPYALVLPHGDAEFRLAVDRGLASLYRSGEIGAVFDRWLGPLGRPSALLDALYYLQAIPE